MKGMGESIRGFDWLCGLWLSGCAMILWGITALPM